MKHNQLKERYVLAVRYAKEHEAFMARGVEMSRRAALEAGGVVEAAGAAEQRQEALQLQSQYEAQLERAKLIRQVLEAMPKPWAKRRK